MRATILSSDASVELECRLWRASGSEDGSVNCGGSVGSAWKKPDVEEEAEGGCRVILVCN
jgi:hypothetical protein